MRREPSERCWHACARAQVSKSADIHAWLWKAQLPGAWAHQADRLVDVAAAEQCGHQAADALPPHALCEHAGPFCTGSLDEQTAGHCNGWRRTGASAACSLLSSRLSSSLKNSCPSCNKFCGGRQRAEPAGGKLSGQQTWQRRACCTAWSRLSTEASGVGSALYLGPSCSSANRRLRAHVAHRCVPPLVPGLGSIARTAFQRHRLAVART